MQVGEKTLTATKICPLCLRFAEPSAQSSPIKGGIGSAGAVKEPKYGPSKELPRLGHRRITDHRRLRQLPQGVDAGAPKPWKKPELGG